MLPLQLGAADAMQSMKRREFITLLGGATAAVARSVQPAQSSRWVARRLAMFGVRRCDFVEKK